jgi:hypothetical protein
MTSAWFLGAQNAVEQSESQVRSTVEPLRNDSATAEAVDAPDFNEFDSDESGELVGLTPRMVGSDTVDSQQEAPWWAPAATYNHNAIIDNQVASSGTAAAREMAGEQGHGTMQYELGLEPVIRDGARYGNDYFLTAPNVIQEGAGSYMTPNPEDHWTAIAQQADAIASSRQAYQNTNFAAFLNG